MNSSFSLKNPVFIRFKKFSITSYGIYFAIGFFIYLQSYYHLLILFNIETTPSESLSIGIIQAVFFIIGTKLLRVIYSIRLFKQDPIAVLRKNGNSFYGGVFGIATGTYIISSLYTRIPWITLLDIAFLSLPLFQIFIRLGCASYGCCYGHLYSGPTSITYHDPLSLAYRRVGSMPIHASQLYSVSKNIFLFFINISIFRLSPYPGVAIATWFCIYPTLRFFVDFTRASEKSKTLWKLRTSQVISSLLFILSIALLFSIKKEGPYSIGTDLLPSLLTSFFKILFALPSFLLCALAFGISFVAHQHNSELSTSKIINRINL